MLGIERIERVGLQRLSGRPGPVISPLVHSKLSSNATRWLELAIWLHKR
jgi:hypothetical protein